MFTDEKHRDYLIVTDLKCHDYYGMDEIQENEFRESLYNEQNDVVRREIKTGNVIIHFLDDSAFQNESYIYTDIGGINEYIECLAVKDGVDVVRYPNGNIGYIAYYNGNVNGFEIIETDMDYDDFMEKYMEV